MSARPLKAAHDGYCRACQGTVARGQRILRFGDSWGHFACVTEYRARSAILEGRTYAAGARSAWRRRPAR